MKFGKAFSDNVVYERQRRGLFATRVPSWWFGSGRALLFASATFIAFFVLFWRLFSLTVVEGHTYRLLSDTNRTRQLTVHAPRGQLLDRTGKPLAFNSAYVRVMKPCETNPKTLCLTKISVEEAEELKKQTVPADWFLEADYRREYSLPDALFHVVGYVGEVSADELKDEYYQLRGYRMGDAIGRFGAEAVFEDELRGKDGREFVEVDAKGSVIRVLGKSPSVPGTDILLSLDKGLSDAAYRAFPKDVKGAVVVSKPSTGEILALYSSPGFSSERLSRGVSADEYRLLMENPDRPLFNRAIGGVYPPGSTFKLITSAAALEEDAIQKSTLVEDVGKITIGPYSFPTWNFLRTGKTDGMVDVVMALQKSNDIFFYKAGEWLGISKLGAWARKMGVGSLLGIELPGEAQGLMPDPSWKNKRFDTPEDVRLRNNEWYLGDTYHAAIGQGYVLTTPLQVNAWTNAIANGGYLCKPTIRKVETEKDVKKHCTDLQIKKETIDLVTSGMKKACASGGTGWPLFGFGVRKQILPDGSTQATSSGVLRPIPVGCKTGTAEFGDPKERTHAWFTAFAPLPEEYNRENSSDSHETDPVSGEPEIAVTVLLEEAGEGSDKAAPVAKEILQEWFNR